MKAALLTMIAAGTAVGLLLPAAKHGPAPGADAALIVTPQSAAPARNAEIILTRESNGHFYTAADVNGQPVKFLVDTGATGVALTVADAKTAGIAVDRGRFESVGTGAGGTVYGQRVHIRELAVEGKRVGDLTAVVIDGLTISLLGQAYLRTLDSVQISGDTMTLR